MKKTLAVCLVILMIACKKKEEATPAYTVSYYAYSKTIPFAVKYHDDAMVWSTDSVYTHTFSKSMNSTKSGQMYVLHGMNKKKVANDSIYVKMTIGDMEAHDFVKFSNSNADIQIQLTSK